MQGKSQNKKVAAIIAAIILVLSVAIGGSAIAANISANAAGTVGTDAVLADGATAEMDVAMAGETVNSISYNHDTVPSVVSVVSITSSAAPGSFDATGVTLDDASFLSTPRDEVEDDPTVFKLLVNPISKGQTGPDGKGILIAFDPYADGDGTASILYAPITQKFYESVVTPPAEGQDEIPDSTGFMPKYQETTAPNPTWETAAKKITYNAATGVLTLPTDAVIYNNDITVYNFLLPGQENAKHTYYGSYILDGQERSFGTSQILVPEPYSDPTKNFNSYYIGTEAVDIGGVEEPVSIVNAVLHKMPQLGGDGNYLGFIINKVRVFSFAIDASNNIESIVELDPQSDFNIESDNRITFRSDLNANNLLIVSDVSTNPQVQSPINLEKHTDSLVFAAVTGYDYKIYTLNDKGVYKEVTSAKRTISDGKVTFSNLDSNTKYYVEYIAPNGEKSKKKPFKTSKEEEVKTFKFKVGDQFSGKVYIGKHTSGGFRPEGAPANWSIGGTNFIGTKLTSIGDPKGSATAEGAAQLKELFIDSGKNSFTATCISPGNAYSSESTRTCTVKVIKADEETGKVKLLVWTEGNWGWTGVKYKQNIAGNPSVSSSLNGRIVVEKASKYPSISHSLETDGNGGNRQVNENYSLGGAKFKVYKFAGTKNEALVDTIVTDDDGRAETDDLPVNEGPYRVEEVTAPQGYYTLSDAENNVVVKLEAGEVSEVNIDEEEQTGTFKMQKHSTDSNSEKNDYYNFGGITYKLKGVNYEKEYLITLNDQGYGEVDFIAYDDYILSEVETNQWYQKSNKTYPVTIDEKTTSSGTKPVEYMEGIEDEPKYVWIDLDKKTYNPAITDHNAAYDLRGAKYQITCQTSGTTSDINSWLPKVSLESGIDELDIIETGWDKENNQKSGDKNNGYGKSVKLLYGDYQIKEIKDAPRYAIDPCTYSIPHTKWGEGKNAKTWDTVSPAEATYTVVQGDRIAGTSTTPDDEASANLKDNPDVDFTFVLDKHDDMSDFNTGQGNTNLSAIFEIRYYNVENPTENSEYDSDTPFDVWYIKTDENGHANLDDLLERNEDGSIKTTEDGKYGIGKTFTGTRIEQSHNDTTYEYKQNTVNASARTAFQSVANNNGRVYIKEDANGELHATIPVGIIEVEEVVAPVGYRYESGSLYGRDSFSVDSMGRPSDWASEVGDNTPAVVHRIINPEIVKGDEGWESGKFDTEAAKKSVTWSGGKVSDHIYRGDIAIQKKDAETSTPMPYIPFLITSKTTGEQHIVVTNPDGYYTSRSEILSTDGTNHSYNTNYNDTLVPRNADGRFDEAALENIDGSLLNYHAGTYFYGYGPDKGAEYLDLGAKDPYNKLYDIMMSNRDGALPYDTYIIQELRIKPFELNGQKYAGNEGYNLVTREFSVTKSDVMAYTFDINDSNVYIHTTATDANGSHLGAVVGDTVTIYDEVAYDGLIPGPADAPNVYTMTGTLMDKSTGEPLKDAEGNTFVVSKDFTPQQSQGTVTLEFKVPSEVIAGTATVVFEKCTLGIDVWGEHTDIEDEGQTVTYPEIHTTATDSVTGDHEGSLLDETITVVDAVQCKGLIIGKEYVVSGTLMNKETGKELVDENGKTFNASTTFTAETVDQTVEIRFEVPSRVIAGKTVVAFENVYNEGILIGTHADLNDKDQTVYYPAIRTTATDSVTKDHEGLANETITINDLVEYENLIKGETYTISGKIMDKGTGEALKGPDGKEFVASTTFVAGEANAASKELREANALVKAYLETADKMLALLDKMSSDEVAAAAEQMNRETLPAFNAAEIKAAVEAASKDGSAVWTDEQKEMLKSFDDFYLSLTDEQKKETGELVSVEKLTSAVDTISTAAKAAEAAEGTAAEDVERVSGSVIVSFEIPADVVRGKATVVFENLYFGEEPTDENHKAKHEDINDEGQTVVYPEIGTTATIDGQKIAPARDVITIIDTVEYKNLTPGKEYTLKGKLMDKTTNETVKNEDGSEVVGETVFTPEQPDGTVEVQFVFNAMAIQFHDVVVFEEAWRQSDVASETILVAEHKDINDEDQTVRIDDAGLADELIETGPLLETGDIVFYVLVTAIILAGSYWFAFRHRKRNLFD